MTVTKTNSGGDVLELNSADFDASDTADMVVSIGGKPTGWIWTFAGPGHDKTIAQAERIAREHLQETREQSQARVNGKKWKAPDEDVGDVRAKNIKWIVERLITWSPVKLDGTVLEFSPDAATTLLSDPRKADLLAQALEFLSADDSFTKRSATT